MTLQVGEMTPGGHTVNARDWPEHFDKDNGAYWCNCTTCGEHFVGPKRSFTCKVCAAKRTSRNPSPRPSPAGGEGADVLPTDAERCEFVIKPEATP